MQSIINEIHLELQMVKFICMTYLADKGLDQSTLTDIFAPKPFGDLRRNLWRYLIYNSINSGHAYGEGHVLVEDVQDLSIPILQ